MGMMIFRPGQRLVIPGVQVFQPRVASAATPGILDGISNVAAAYSLRKLRSAYTGAAVLVRNSSNVELPIGFASDGEFDTAAYNTHVAGGPGYVKTWYDQGVSGRDVTQATTGSQPRIALSTVNGKPTVIFSGAQYLTASYAVSVTAQTFIAVAAYSGSTGYQRIYTQAPADNNDYLNTAGNFIPLLRDNANNNMSSYIDAGTRSSVALAPGTYAALSSRHTGSTLTNYVNGNPGSAYSNSLSKTYNYHRLGWSLASGNDASYLTGGICEAIAFSAAISTADHNTVGADMATRFGLSWTTVT